MKYADNKPAKECAKCLERTEREHCNGCEARTLQLFIRWNVISYAIVILLIFVACRSHGGQKIETLHLSARDIARLEAAANRSYIVSRQVVGDTIVEQWRQGNKTWWTTNKVVKIEGRKMQTTFREKIAKKDAEIHTLEVTNAVIVAENIELVATNAVLEVDAKKAQKVEKNAEKAKKKDQKNFEKWVSDTEKAKSKSSSEMAEFYDSVLELAGAKGNE